MYRSASEHSKAAKEAYARGDHLSAKKFSRKAQEERIAAKTLHAVAAKKILSIKNCKNNKWTLDLHGLHADEAVQALQKHLQKIESANRSTKKSSSSIYVILDFLSFIIGKKRDVPMAKKKKRNVLPSSSGKSETLKVITGRGNHSRGEAKLPVAIRRFLDENGYHYDDEARLGVIIISL